MKKLRKILYIFLIILLISNYSISTIAIEEDSNKVENSMKDDTEIVDELDAKQDDESNLDVSDNEVKSNENYNEIESNENYNESENNEDDIKIQEEEESKEVTNSISIPVQDESSLETKTITAPSNTPTTISAPQKKLGVTYKTHVQDIGWQGWKSNGSISGTEGKAKRLEGIYIKLENANGVKIRYKTHIQDIGWQGWKSNGDLSGTEGKAKRLEAIKIELQNSSSYSIRYRVHIQDIGWQSWKYDGELAGTEGQAKRLEAIQIEIVNKVNHGNIVLESNVANIYYNKNQKVNISGYKVSNLEETTIRATIDNTRINNVNYKARNDVIKSLESRFGTVKENPNPGFSFSLDLSSLSSGNHTLKLELLTKDNKVLKTYSKTFKIDTGIHVFYKTHVQDFGWQGETQDGGLSGTQGQAKRLEAIKINAVNLPSGVSIKYRTHIQEIGWQGWKSNNQLAGTEGQAKRLEGIRIKLEGTSQYSVRYRVHVQDIGWQDWCYDGETAGTEGQAKRLEAIEIQIVSKISQNKVYLMIDSPSGTVQNKAGTVKGWIMSSVPNVSIKLYIDNSELNLSNMSREKRQDVLNAIKGYGDETVNNPNPGFSLPIDFSAYSLGGHTIKLQAILNNQVLAETSRSFNIEKSIVYGEGVYGVSGLKAVGDSRGTDLKYLRYGNGPNVFFGTFAVHGFEDLWSMDGWELATIANEFYNTLVNSNDMSIHDKWTIYLFPGVNMDGLNYGYTNNGPGRTTLTSLAPGGRGIDLNRCWQTGSGYERFGDGRNYNGTEGFQAYESRYLRDFLLNHKSVSGQTVLVDLHGWTQQLIGDSTVCSYYGRYFPENNRSTVGRYGNGYLINWARMALGNSNRAAKSALIELPNSGVYNHQSVMNKNFYGKYIQATLDMLRGM